MKLAVISGAWCTGKTNMANKLFEMLGWPVFALDFYKEKRFDRGETGRLNEESYDDLFKDLDDVLQKDQSCIVESDFTDERQVQRLIDVGQKVNADFVQVYLFADNKILLQRFIDRLESGERHSGHGDEQYLQKAKDELESGNDFVVIFAPLEFPGSLIKIDTSDFDQVDYDSIVERINTK
ncbi:MAG: AAA family ATPase [Patescibacteria group bacterium]